MSTWLQVYGTDGANDYRANCKRAEEAALVAQSLGAGATIRQGKDVLWTVGDGDGSILGAIAGVKAALERPTKDGP